MDPDSRNCLMECKALLRKVAAVKHFTSFDNKIGKVQRFQFSDSSGTIELVAFNEFCDIDSVQSLKVGTVYRIKSANVKETNNNRRAWKSETCSNYDLYVTKSTTLIALTEEDFKKYEPVKPEIEKTNETPCKNNKYFDEFLPLDMLHSKKWNSFVNTVGIVSSIADGLKDKEIAGKWIKVKNFRISNAAGTTVIKSKIKRICSTK